jgi:glycosyltransferase A (GT-A) superfamily protein (DUF2064 family)
VNVTVLIVAKAPVAGLVKTRLTPPATSRQAARIAAAALLDTLEAARRTGAPVAVALAGRLGDAERAAELSVALRGATVLAQRGATFADRLVNAHADAARLRPAAPVLQIGGDTPQLTADLLVAAAVPLSTVDAVLGMSRDGGWWTLGLCDPIAARALRGVALSRPDTGAQTLQALRDNRLRVALLPVLSDVDTMADAVAVARDCPAGHFRTAVREAGVRR